MPANAQQAMEDMRPPLTAYGRGLYTLQGLIWSLWCLNPLVNTKSYYRRTFDFQDQCFEIRSHSREMVKMDSGQNYNEIGDVAQQNACLAGTRPGLHP